MSGEIIFGGCKGVFKWEDGNKDMFFSERHLAKDKSEFGENDFFDMLSYFSTWTNQKDDSGNYVILRNPVDIINERLKEKLLSLALSFV